MFYSIRYFDLSGEVWGCDTGDRGDVLKDIVIGGRKEAREACARGDRLFEAKLIAHADLGKSPDGVGRRRHAVLIWEAHPIDPKNPSLGFQERFHSEVSDLLGEPVEVGVWRQELSAQTVPVATIEAAP